MSILRLFCLALVAFASPHSPADAGGTIRGVVLDASGHPVSGAKVHPSEINIAGHRLIRYYETDGKGEFAAKHLAWGTYRVLAGKESEGYPDLPSAFDGYGAFPVVRLQPQSPTVSVVIHLPPKSGIIASILVADAATDRRVESAAVTLRRADNPAAAIETSATVRPILLPSNTDVHVEISAGGYESWPAKGSAKGEGLLHLRAGEVIKLDVSLAPEGFSARSTATISPAVLPPPPKPVRYPYSTILPKPVESFRVSGEDISVPLRQLADRFGVPIGFESLPRIPENAKPGGVQIDMKAGTVADVLDAIVSADPRYTWEELDGVENVFPKEHRGSLPDVVVASLSAKNVDCREALHQLLKSPEVEGWVAATGVTLREPPSTTTPRVNGGGIIYSLTLANRSIREVLNSLLGFSGSNFWTYYRYGDHSQFFTISIGE
jgi:hypothetical protein